MTYSILTGISLFQKTSNNIENLPANNQSGECTAGTTNITDIQPCKRLKSSLKKVIVRHSDPKSMVSTQRTYVNNGIEYEIFTENKRTKTGSLIAYCFMKDDSKKWLYLCANYPECQSIARDKNGRCTKHCSEMRL